MKMSKRFLAVLSGLLAMAMLLAACSGSPSASPSENAATPAPADSPAAADTPQAEAGEEAPQQDASGLPLVSEPTTMTMWIQMSPAIAEVIQDFNENEMYQELEKRTGVHIEFIIPPAAEAQQSLNVLIASDNYPDILHLLPFTNPSYPGGTDKGIEDGVILNVDDLVEQYMPNMKALMASGDDVAKAVVTDGGHIAGFYNIATVAQTPWYGLAIRQDWLDDVGMEKPVTYDDLYNVLKAFKEQKGAIAPMMIPYLGVDSYNTLTAGYGVSALSTDFFCENGTVKYGIIEPGYREYLEMMNKWYAEGLIDQDFPTRTTDFTAPEAYTTTGKTGVWNDMYVNLAGLKNKTDDPNFQAVGLANPVKNAGDTLHFGQHNARVGRNMHVITTKCKDPVLAVKWFDYQYGDEGSLLTNYGVEGKTFSYVDGEPTLNEFITNNPDGLTLAQAMGVYLKPPGGGTRYYWQRELANMAPENLEAPQIWKSNVDFAWMIPGHAVLTSEEGDEYVMVMGDIQTYVEEMTLKFILGQELLSNFDAFVAQIKSMDIDRAIALKQASYDRYDAR